MTIVDSSTADTSASIGDIVTSGGSNNTKGSWTEAIASTSEETYWLTIVFKGAVNDVNFLVDIGVGAAASEVVQIANIPFFSNTSTVSGVMATPCGALPTGTVAVTVFVDVLITETVSEP